MRVSSEWTDKRMADLASYRRNQTPIDVISQYNLAIQWLVAMLAREGVPFRLIQLGAGVKRVTTLTDVCPKCNGTGKC